MFKDTPLALDLQCLLAAGVHDVIGDVRLDTAPKVVAVPMVQDAINLDGDGGAPVLPREAPQLSEATAARAQIDGVDTHENVQCKLAHRELESTT